MKIEYAFVNGEHSEVEVSEEIGTFILDSRRVEENNGRVYRRHNYSYEQGEDDGFLYGYEESTAFELLSIIEQLPDVQRRRILLVVQGYSTEEIAAMEGVSDRGVRKTIETAKKNLKTLLEQEN